MRATIAFLFTPLLLLPRCVSDSIGGPANDGGIGDGSMSDNTMGDGTSTDSPDGSASKNWHLTASGPSHARAIVVDALGGIYIGGWFSGTMTYDGGAVTSQGGEDAFVMRVDPVKKRPDWVFTFGGDADAGARGERITALANDGKGGIFFAASVESPRVTIGTDTFKFAHPFASHSSVVARLDAANGKPVWAISPDANRQTMTYFSECNGLAFNANVMYAACTYSGSEFGFDGNSFVEPSPPQGAAALFAIDVMNGPTESWKIAVRGTNAAIATAVTVAPNDQVFMAGGAYNPNPGRVQIYDSANKTWLDVGSAIAGQPGGFVISTPAKGQPVTSVGWGGTAMYTAALLRGLATHNNDLVGAGFFAGTVDFGQGPLSVGLPRNGIAVGLSAGLAPAWSRDLGGMDTDELYDIVRASNGWLVVGSYVSKDVKFAGVSLPNPSGNGNGFVGRLDPMGKPISGAAIDATGKAQLDAIAIDPKVSAFYAVGSHSGTVTLDDGTMISAATESMLLIRRDW